jgi:hypothetical protein
LVIPIISLALFVMGGVFAVIFVRGLTTGVASTRYHPRVERAANPVGFWAAQTFNAIFAVACVVGGIIAMTGI